MNALDVLKYGDGEVAKATDGLDDWNTPGVTTSWSAKDVLAHLASFERFLEEAMLELLGRGPTPTLDAMRADAAGFNAAQVGSRRNASLDAVRREYDEAHARVMGLAAEIGPDRLRQPGTIAWYGPSYALDDLIVYANYAHKREHCAQIRAFRLRHAPARRAGE
ncbi:MAG TPA: DinB family protein [Candidatus Eisenbacteria bacterium]|nr:DinB family protein [Candidatus Eisenbacteria bacterium]